MISGLTTRGFRIGQNWYGKGKAVTFPDNQFADLEMIGFVERVAARPVAKTEAKSFKD